VIRWLVRNSEQLAQWLCLLALIALFLALCSCGEAPYDECNPAPDPYPLSQHYSPRPDTATPLGVRVDRNSQNVDLNRVDQAVAQVEGCLGRPIEAHCLRVYVPTAWQMSCNVRDGGHYMLLSEEPADQRACAAKHLEETGPDCPCLWRVLTQGSTIIAPPDLRMLPGAIVSLATGVADPWSDPELAQCAAPMGPLPGE
jgi:hypothetical protein